MEGVVCVLAQTQKSTQLSPSPVYLNSNSGLSNRKKNCVEMPFQIGPYVIPGPTGVHLINATDMSIEEEQSANGSGVLSQLTGD